MVLPLFQPGPASDPVYRNIRDLPRGERLRDRFEEKWRRYSAVCGDPSEHFRNDAREHFLARAWEMHLGCILMDFGFVLERPGSGAPDHLVRLGQQRLWIEDTIVHPGTGPDAVRELPMDGEMHLVERDPMLLRYAQAIRSKWEQWSRFALRKTVSLDDPFVIALNGGLLTWANVERGVPDIVRPAILSRDGSQVPQRGTRPGRAAIRPWYRGDRPLATHLRHLSAHRGMTTEPRARLQFAA